jgi:hypothetical protein
LKLKLAQKRIKVQLCNVNKQLSDNTLHIILAVFITLQSFFSGLAAKTDIRNNSSIQENFTLINLNKEHAHSESSGIILFFLNGESEAEFSEPLTNIFKQIKSFFALLNSFLSVNFDHDSNEIIKCENTTYRPSLLHIPLFLFTADLRI